MHPHKQGSQYGGMSFEGRSTVNLSLISVIHDMGVLNFNSCL